ncbi:MAG: hypothetical protein WDN23_05260 [Edaphobacter sp.]
MAKEKAQQTNRLTVSLGPGQRKVLENIADLNGVKLAFVVRYALTHFINENRDKQFTLRFPTETES